MEKNNKKIIKIVILSALIILVLIISIYMIIKFSYKKFNTIDISDCTEKTCIKKFNKNSINISYDNNDVFKFKLNDKDVFMGGGILKLGNKIYTFDETILYSTIIENVNNITVILFTTGGKETIISELLDKSMSIQDFEVKENTITFSGTRFINDKTLIYGNTPDTQITIDSCEMFEKNKDLIVAGKYKMTYLDDNKFSDIERIETTTLENYGNFKDLCK